MVSTAQAAASEASVHTISIVSSPIQVSGTKSTAASGG